MTIAPALNLARFSHTSIVMAKNLFVFGGRNDSTFTGSIEMMNVI